MATTDTLETGAAHAVTYAGIDAHDDGVATAEQDSRDLAEGDAEDSAEVRLAGTFREVSWVTRTAQLYVDGEDGGVTTVRFTEAQDGWMRLVANVPVNVRGTVGDAMADAYGNGRADFGIGSGRIDAARANKDNDSADEGVAEDESGIVNLTEVRAAESGWQQYDIEDYLSVMKGYRYDPATHKMLSFSWSEEGDDDDDDDFYALWDEARGGGR